MAKVKFEDAVKGLEDIVERLSKMEICRLMRPCPNTRTALNCTNSVLPCWRMRKKIQILVKDENGIRRTKDFEIGSAQSDNSK